MGAFLKVASNCRAGISDAGTTEGSVENAQPPQPPMGPPTPTPPPAPERAARTIQALWRLTRLRKVIGSIQRIRARLSAANNGIEQHARVHRFTQGSRSPRGGGGADGAYNQAWLAVRGAASEIVHDVTVPLLPR